MTLKRVSLFVVIGLSAVAVAVVLRSRMSAEPSVRSSRWSWGSPAWAPDGKRFALVGGPDDVCGGEIYLVGAQGGRPRAITRLVDAKHLQGLNSPTWSPDGKKIAFTRIVLGLMGFCSDYEIDVIDADGGSHTRLRTGSTSLAAFECLAWSPDGRRIMFLESGVDRVVVMKVDGSKRRQLAKASSGFGVGCPVWSPDGRRIAFVRGGVSGEIYLVDLNGNEKRLTHTHGNASYPAWASDGSRLAFIAADRGEYSDSYSVRTVRPDGTSQKRIKTEGETLELYDLTWSPDRRNLAYGRSPLGSVDNTELVVINADGSERRARTNRFLVAWSPDGSKIAIGQGRRFYIVRASQFGHTKGQQIVLKE